ncbi:peptidoglycan DD-metalloendopeptidase family protein [Ancylobacter sp. SL191]|uniref:peptidoglycan DD-metalloendopeptidase family protein n=1 Tax=Ancylobacter sp. SL191 TaxID=2995166 RepID=UPI0022711EC1|nr:peptidoglycan DD-metalloendopeptidase family protein [Ancylobacter sp. SL191]WAC26121.1 peptidoglycan DD-metalloendopeptidase family protein [Ancylobacter sp. SL191]
MRNFLTTSGSSSLVRLSVVALLGGTAAACSSDTGRFNDPNASPFATSAGAPSYTGSVAAAPTGVVQQAPMGGPMGSQVAAAPLASPSAPPYPAPYGSTSAPAYPAPYGAPQQLASAAPNYPVAAAAPTSYPAAAPVPATQPLYGAQPQQLAPQAAAPRAPQMAAAGGGSHVVKPGETLSSIARNYGVPRGTLAAANGLDINAQVQIGRTLTIPGAGAAAANPVAAAPKPATTPVVAAAPQPVAPAAPAAPKPAAVASAPATPAPVAVEKPQTIAAVKPAETPDDMRTSSGTQFRWPVRGRVISTFGPKPGGQQNEGINVSVPEGTAVKAAEDGVVAYAGSELKGYGNLVLIKHADGYVTAYAHNSELEVKKGDTVKRGQVIAKAGQTGNVTSPQVHFEIRKGSQPVDPSQYLAGL